MDAGLGLYGGELHELLEITWQGFNLQLWVQPSTGRISKLATVENDVLHRNVLLEVFFSGWTSTDQVAFPSDVLLTLRQEARSR